VTTGKVIFICAVFALVEYLYIKQNVVTLLADSTGATAALGSAVGTAGAASVINLGDDLFGAAVGSIL
jgi:hypothetical protein